MHRDYKTGLVVGLVLAVIALIWVATRPGLSPEARMMRSAKATSQDSGPGAASPEATADPGRGDNPKSEIPNLQSKKLSAQEAGSQTSGTLSSPQPAVRNPQPGPTQNLTAYELPEKIKTTRFHIVRKEETLSTISQQYYGTPNNWRKILDANKNAVKDANKIQPGTKLIIPD
jgi:nucleoid-associated protein YgaU